MDAVKVAHTAKEVWHASQHEGELVRVLDLVWRERPSVILEIGCDAGGTLWAWRQVAPHVFGITTANNSAESGGSGRPLETHDANVIIGDSHDPVVVAELAVALDGRPVDVLVIDGDHSIDGVRADWLVYRQLVRRGGLALFHDITVTSDPRAQVFKVWPDIAADHDVAEILEPGGYGWGVVYL